MADIIYQGVPQGAVAVGHTLPTGEFVICSADLALQIGSEDGVDLAGDAVIRAGHAESVCTECGVRAGGDAGVCEETVEVLICLVAGASIGGCGSVGGTGWNYLGE